MIMPEGGETCHVYKYEDIFLHKYIFQGLMTKHTVSLLPQMNIVIYYRAVKCNSPMLSLSATFGLGFSVRNT